MKTLHIEKRTRLDVAPYVKITTQCGAAHSKTTTWKGIVDDARRILQTIAGGTPAKYYGKSYVFCDTCKAAL